MQNPVRGQAALALLQNLIMLMRRPGPGRKELEAANVLLAMVASIVALALAAAPPNAAAPSNAGPSLSAGTIFAKARVAMYLRSYPHYVAYIIDIQSTAYGKHYHEGYRAMLRTH